MLELGFFYFCCLILEVDLFEVIVVILPNNNIQAQHLITVFNRLHFTAVNLIVIFLVETFRTA